MTETARIIHLDTVDSTNEEALRQLAAGSALPLWIRADEQYAGRGRNGRPWHSPRGNLYASYLVKTAVPPAIAAQLSFVAALSAFDVIAALTAPQRVRDLKLKWPNDVMLNDAKIAGVLLESISAPGGNLAVILGTGINLSHSPDDTGRAVANLGLSTSGEIRARAFELLASRSQLWLTLWDEGRGFGTIRSGWLQRAFPLGTPISVNLNSGPIHGTFRGIAPSGALEMETQPGMVTTITAGDVMFGAPR